MKNVEIKTSQRLVNDFYASWVEVRCKVYIDGKLVKEEVVVVSPFMNQN